MKKIVTNFLHGIIICFLLISCSSNVVINNHSIVYFTGAEYTSGNYLTDSIGFSEFSNTSFRTKSFAYRGESSIKIDSINEYGFGLTINTPQKGEHYKISVWQKKGEPDGCLMCILKGEKEKSIRTYTINKYNNEWYQHTLSFTLPENIKEVSFYVFSGGKTAYFDDIRIERFTSVPKPDTLINMLNIYIPSESQLLLDSYKENALKNGVISNLDKKYVKAFILNKQDSIPIKIRLKGDWTDHLTTAKISYRIKIKDDDSFMGLKTFSVQHPKTRKYMHEWFMHKLCDREDLLATKFDFIPITINGVYKGVYALEEHFEKQLLESRKRRDGPILKMDETGVWEVTMSSKKNSIKKIYPSFEASYVTMFNKNKNFKNEYLKNQFIIGAYLLTLYKNGYNKTEELFDIENLAKYYALLEIGNVHHAHEWHNRRFYFNPISQFLEPIGYDMLPDDENSSELYIYNKLNSEKGYSETQLLRKLLFNTEFKKQYFIYLKQFSSKEFLNTAFNELDSKIIKNETLLNLEDNYKFDKKFYLNQANKIRNELPQLEKLWNTFLKDNHIDDVYILTPNYKPHQDTTFIKSVSVNSYVHKLDSSKYKLELENYHLNDVEIIGYKIKNGAIIYLDKSIKLTAYSSFYLLSKATIVVNKKPKQIIFKISNNPNQTYSKKVFNWQKPKEMLPKMELSNIFNKQSSL